MAHRWSTSICGDSSSYLLCLQGLPWLLDEDTLVDSTHTTERVRLGCHLQVSLLSWDSWGGRKLHRHLTHTEDTKHTIWIYVYQDDNLWSHQTRKWRQKISLIDFSSEGLSNEFTVFFIKLTPLCVKYLAGERPHRSHSLECNFFHGQKCWTEEWSPGT